MKQTIINNNQEELLRVLSKGMVALPKKWWEALKITTGDVIRAKREGKRVIIETQQEKFAPYRVYTDKEIDEFLKEDTLPDDFAEKVQNNLSITTCS